LSFLSNAAGHECLKALTTTVVWLYSMVSFIFWSKTTSSSKPVESEAQDTPQQTQRVSSPTDAGDSRPLEVPEVSQAESEGNLEVVDSSVPAAGGEKTSSTSVSAGSAPTPRSFGLFQSRSRSTHKPIVTTEQEKKKERQAVNDLKRVVISKATSSRSDKRAKKSAEVVRSLIIGTDSTPSGAKKRSPSKAQIDKVKADLAKPKSANKLIAQLRQLDFAPDSSTAVTQPHTRGPILAVCLDASDEEVSRRHISQPKAGPDAKAENRAVRNNFVTASVENVTSMLGDMHVVSLLSTDFGFGQPADADGILAGAVPSAETVMSGIELITPQLLSLGFATGQAIIPDHKGVHPPTDRISVLTYWWGFEIVLPPPSLNNLEHVQSITHTMLTLLTALTVVSEGVREVLPFVRYISQFMDFEFNAIKSQNKGKGVVCAATWVMPVALVPRPWDFDPAPDSLPSTEPAKDEPVASIPDPIKPPGGSQPPIGDNPPFVIQPTPPTGDQPHVGVPPEDIPPLGPLPPGLGAS